MFNRAGGATTRAVDKANRTSSHQKRIASAVLGIPLLIALVFYGTPLHFWLLITCCIILGLLEFYRILARANINCFTLLGLGLGLLISLIFWKGATLPVSALSVSALAISLVVIVPFWACLFHPGDLSVVIPRLFGTIGGVFYVAWLLAHLIWIRGLLHGKVLIFYLLLVTWVGDTAAFYGGRLMGRHRLSPRISPKKTIEGSVAGLVGSIIVSIIAHFTFLRSISLGNCISLGFLLNLLGQLGDLSESLLKRGAGVKDSGNIIPGHGGLLDRIDSLIFASPALFYYVAIII